MIRVNSSVRHRYAGCPGRTPTVSAVTNTWRAALSVSWTAPADNGLVDHGLRPALLQGKRGSGGRGGLGHGRGTRPVESRAQRPRRLISGLLANTAYRVQVRAENAGGESAWSVSGTATTGSPPATNNAPRVLEAKTGDANNCLPGEDRNPPRRLSDPCNASCEPREFHPPDIAGERDDGLPGQLHRDARERQGRSPCSTTRTPTP